ncbi:MAG: C-GCAxxG-C-C family protein [Lachnospiraceae bacterium]
MTEPINTISEIAGAYHKEGYNCCQAVVKATAIPEHADLLVQIASSFGGGIGGQRQTCGTVTGIAIVLGDYYGYNTPETGEIKKEHTELIASACTEFKKIAGSLVCGELLCLPGFTKTPVEQKLTCNELVKLAAGIVDKYKNMTN